MWSLLPNRGNSTMPTRIALLDTLIKTFPAARIVSLTGDREFVGKAWMRWLVENKIDFILRLKENQYIVREGYQTESIADLAVDLRVGQTMTIRHWRQLHQDPDEVTARLKLVILRLKTGELLALTCTAKPRKALSDYRHRWTIESLFANLKTRGFNMEDTHLTQPDKLSTLLVLLALAVAISIKTGVAMIKIKPVTVKTHGRKAASVFAVGLTALRKIFTKTDHMTVKQLFERLLSKQKATKALLRKALGT